MRKLIFDFSFNYYFDFLIAFVAVIVNVYQHFSQLFHCRNLKIIYCAKEPKLAYLKKLASGIPARKKRIDKKYLHVSESIGQSISIKQDGKIKLVGRWSEIRRRLSWVRMWAYERKETPTRAWIFF
jgi:hypothetical protein